MAAITYRVDRIDWFTANQRPVYEFDLVGDILPVGLASDNNGNLYVSLIGGARVEIIDPV